MIRTLFTAAILTAVSLAAVHADATDPTVKARQAAMKTIGGNVKTLGDMAKGAIAFDAMKAQAATAAITEQAAMVPALFEPQASDPESDAKPAIWENYGDFTTKAKALETAAAGVTIASAADLGAAMGSIGGTCKACHSVYKQ